MRVAFDARALGIPALAERGIGRYVRSLLDALREQPVELAVLTELGRPPAPPRIRELWEHVLLARNVRVLGPREYEQGVFIADKLIGIAEASALARFEEQRGMQLGAERERLMARTTTIDSSTTTVVTRVPQRVVETDTGELVPRARAELMAMQDQMPGVESRLDARGLVIRLGDFMFEPGRADLTPTAEQSLDQVARVLGTDRDAGIAVEAFGNDGLARERADSVRDYLDARGVDGARIVARSVSYAPGAIASNDRRVDIVIRSDLR